MDQVTCTQCGRPIFEGDWKSKSGLCRSCAEIALQKKRKKRWWIYLIIVYFIAVIIAAQTVDPQEESILDANGYPTQRAVLRFQVIAERAVKDNLKAPKTAEFDTLYDKYFIYDETDTYGYSGTVTAENSFGVPLTDDYFVKFKCWGYEYDEYEILSVTIG